MKILVCGAGVAGLSTAVHLQRSGHDVTLLELAPEVRTAGGPVDVCGDAVGFVRELGLYDELKASEMHMTADIQFVDADGTMIEKFPNDHFFDPGDFEIARTKLLPVLAGALSESTDVRFSTTIASVEDYGDHVHLALTDGSADDYDLVVGADGVHSRTRKLIFGPEEDYADFLGVYGGFAPIGPPASGGAPSQNYSSPGKLIGCMQSDDFELCVVMFRAPYISYDYRDPTAIQRIIQDNYRDDYQNDVWRTRELVDRAIASPGLWFDEITQIKMGSWRKGRVVLVGDAAHCATPLSGRGVSLGVSGGRSLSLGLSEFPDDLDAALARYEEIQRPYVDVAQASPASAKELLLPPTEEAIQVRNAKLREFAGA